MSYELRYHPQVKRSDLPKLDRAAKERIRTAIETRLAEKPERYSEPLRKTLQPYRKLRVGEYWVIFRVNDNTVFILAVLHRKEAYQRARRRIS
ncbi:MAG: type II toxin-antitoxin system RelE/ParE family toxin [Spirochaetaceae bacterium]|nr:MAG: type II toxin-antitoxin system RelE/ParE family toxin [Spirochaetaceae bacterium]